MTIYRVTMYSLDILLSQLRTSPFFTVWFRLLFKEEEAHCPRPVASLLWPLASVLFSVAAPPPSTGYATSKGWLPHPHLVPPLFAFGPFPRLSLPLLFCNARGGKGMNTHREAPLLLIFITPPLTWEALCRPPAVLYSLTTVLLIPC